MNTRKSNKKKLKLNEHRRKNWPNKSKKLNKGVCSCSKDKLSSRQMLS
jgi:hypothetical protein